MPIPWSDRLSRAYAVLRGVMVIVFSMALVFAPEKMMPGSSSEPARSLALVFVSRTMLLGVGERESIGRPQAERGPRGWQHALSR